MTDAQITAWLHREALRIAKSAGQHCRKIKRDFADLRAKWGIV